MFSDLTSVSVNKRSHPDLSQLTAEEEQDSSLQLQLKPKKPKVQGLLNKMGFTKIVNNELFSPKRFSN